MPQNRTKSEVSIGSDNIARAIVGPDLFRHMA